MITRDTVVVGVNPPDIPAEKFKAVLESASSPALVDYPQIYDAITRERVSPAFLLAIFAVESAFGTVGLGMVNKNPGNTRSSITGKGIVVDTSRGKFVRYPSWFEGFKDLAVRLSEPDYVYARNGYRTIGQIIPVFAPVEDSNDPAAYVNSVVKLMNAWIGDNSMVNVGKPDITWVGSPNFWVGRWGEDVLGICDHIMQGTLGSTDGWFNNPASGVSATFGVGKAGAIHQYVSLADSAWANGIVKQPDLSVKWLADFVRRGDNPNHCTVSIEHEGNSGDVMPEAQYQATLRLHKWLLSQFPKITADRQGIIGHYQIDLPDKSRCPGAGFPWTRLITDLAGWKNGGGGKVVPENNTEVLNGHVLGHGFRDFYYKWGGMRILGLPTSEEYTNPDTGCTEQKFERMWLEYDPRETNPDWQIRGKIITSYILK